MGIIHISFNSKCREKDPILVQELIMFPEYMVLLLNFVGAGMYNPPEHIVAPEPCGNVW
jgi:hypothetical protein